MNLTYLSIFYIFTTAWGNGTRELRAQHLIVRKCCEDNKHFSTRTYQCEPWNGGNVFQSYLKGFLSNSSFDISFAHGMRWCPITQGPPEITEISPGNYAISRTGHLIDLKSKADYDHENYCVEVAAGSSEDLDDPVFVASYCPKNIQEPIRKCCNLNQYLDDHTFECSDRTGDMIIFNFLVRDFFPTVSPSTAVSVGELRCKFNRKRITANEMYIDKTGQLCDHSSGICHSSSSYCIEHFGSKTDSKLESSAFVCSSNVFNKCCKDKEVLSNEGCVKARFYHTASSHLSQLKELLLFQVGMETCEQIMISSTEDDVSWLITKDGELSLTTSYGETITEQYCIDDFESKKVPRDTVLVLCLDAVQGLLPRTADYLASIDAISKCCPLGQHLNKDFSCVDNDLQTNFSQKEFVTNNVSDIVFTSYPVCQNEEYYVRIPFGEKSSIDSFGILTEDNKMMIVTMDGSCKSSEVILKNSEYCIDDYFTGEHLDAIIVGCPDQEESTVFPNKYKMILILSSISCVSLIIAALFLIVTRVTRQEQPNKAEKLSVTIELSFVFSNLLAFLFLAIGISGSLQAGPLCYAYGSLLLFFFLAAAMWNTSICLESFLHKIQVKTSEKTRYLCHSLWAWGLPAAIVTIALTLDLNRHSLPCSTITPKFGVYRCFFSDMYAKLLYLYLPMLVTICANVVLLILTKYLNTQKVKRLSIKLKATASLGFGDAEKERARTQGGNTATQQTSVQFDNEYLGIGSKEGIWTKYFKLITWSGVMWTFEIFADFITTDSEEANLWYNWLWHILSYTNVVRGISLFLVMLVFVPKYKWAWKRFLNYVLCVRKTQVAETTT